MNEEEKRKDVFIDDGSDYMSREVVKEGGEIDRLVTYVNNMRGKKYGWVFVGLDIDNHLSEVQSNLDFGLQLEMLEDAIANIKRIGQRV